jgi:hypothetical protein
MMNCWITIMPPNTTIMNTSNAMSAPRMVSAQYCAGEPVTVAFLRGLACILSMFHTRYMACDPLESPARIHAGDQGPFGHADIGIEDAGPVSGKST